MGELTAGLFIGLLGVWVLTQVLGGKALDRLGVTGNTEPAPSGSHAEGRFLPGPGQPMPTVS